MKLSNVEQTNKDLLDKLNSELRNKIAQREKEVENVTKLFDKKIEQQNQLGEEAYLNKVDLNNQRLSTASIDYQNKLQAYKDNLEKNKIELAIQEKSLRENQEAQLSNLKDQFGNVYEATYSNALENEHNIQFKTQNELKNLDDQAHNDVNQLQNKNHQELSLMSMDFNNKTFTNEKNFRGRLEQDILQHQDEIKIQKDQFKKSIDLATQKNQRLENEKLKVQTNELQFMENYHKNLMAQKEKDFRIRFENQTKEHERILNEIKTKLDADIEKVKKESMNTMRSISSKSNDSFYSIEKLEPNLVELPKSYQLSLRVPEHEKENVHLVAHGREIKITFNKKFADINQDEDGSVNRTTKNQLYSKELKTTDLLNPKNIKAKYENDTLTFNIEKL